MFYDDKDYYNTLKFDDVFTSGAEFVTKVGSVGGITDSAKLTELYEVLALKYVASFTRYTSPFAFIQAIKRELYTEFPFYLKKKELADEMMAMEIEEIQIGQRQLRNKVDTHDDPVVDADTVPITDLSTEQESIRMTENKLEAVKNKYNVMNRDYIRGIYRQCDELFRVILAEDDVTLFPEGE
jgi:hypothetical protein